MYSLCEEKKLNSFYQVSSSLALCTITVIHLFWLNLDIPVLRVISLQ